MSALDGSISAYGSALALCFAVNLVVGLWGDLRRWVVAGQDKLKAARSGLDDLAASESTETIATKRLDRTLRFSRWVPNGLWVSARIVGAFFSLVIYIAAVEIPPDRTFDGVLWWWVREYVAPYWNVVEWCAAYLSASLVISMALASLWYGWAAERQIKALQAALTERRSVRVDYQELSTLLTRRFESGDDGTRQQG